MYLFQTGRIRPEQVWSQLGSCVGEDGLQLDVCSHLPLDIDYSWVLDGPRPPFYQGESEETEEGGGGRRGGGTFE